MKSSESCEQTFCFCLWSAASELSSCSCLCCLSRISLSLLAWSSWTFFRTEPESPELQSSAAQLIVTDTQTNSAGPQPFTAITLGTGRSFPGLKNRKEGMNEWLHRITWERSSKPIYCTGWIIAGSEKPVRRLREIILSLLAEDDRNRPGDSDESEMVQISAGLAACLSCVCIFAHGNTLEGILLPRHKQLHNSQ